ncbi:DUF732 domain-containing protein [Mycobacterium stomatepiae]|uniref:DUF732 domain-containing protein n=1 Tax=Mycobacterium stomatepiae TaxID=470076 RepID=A0A7I7Q7Z2_9MYCO|nr:DUF732 domain-containing protein [Mycobacterium stomatepiae]MCV7163013.1 DUF732 domain-containing protein [Mycobacterium stomatepiae]BBY22156.1 hypothetical protein MSTO_23610 [Mycobacterium stomatepiae]
MKYTVAALITGAAVGLAAPAHADPSIDRDLDTNFTNQLSTVGIYGQKDSNAWIGKIMCKRTYNNVDTSAAQSATFVRNQLDRDSSTEQVWQFVGLAVDYYCPDKRGVINHAA